MTLLCEWMFGLNQGSDGATDSSEDRWNKAEEILRESLPLAAHLHRSEIRERLKML